jgi:hypothetical protein
MRRIHIFPDDEFGVLGGHWFSPWNGSRSTSQNAKIVREIIEVEGELSREEDVTEDADLVELAHAAHGARKWPTGYLLALVNVPAILQDGAKVRFRKKASPANVEAEFVYQTWDFSNLLICPKVGRGEQMNDFWPRLQKALGEGIEPAEEYIAWHRRAVAELP